MDMTPREVQQVDLGEENKTWEEGGFVTLGFATLGLQDQIMNLSGRSRAKTHCHFLRHAVRRFVEEREVAPVATFLEFLFHRK